MPKCVITGETIDKNKGFSVIPEGKVKKVYYKNEEIYNKHLQDLKSENNILVLINYVLGKSKYAKHTKQITDKLKKLLQNYTLQDIEFSLELDKDMLVGYRSKGLIYILQVVENRLIQNKEVFDKKNKLKTIKIEIDDTIGKLVNEYKYEPKKYDVRRFENG
jgi:hypothetical protein